MSIEKYFAVVPAAGIGTRMQSATAKQYLPLRTSAGASSMLELTLNALLSAELLRSVTVCLAVNDQHWGSLSVSKNSRIRTAIGGETRAHSVLSGLESLRHQAVDTDWVLVHDAARPCLAPDLLPKLIAELRGDEVGGILAIPVSDTLKLGKKNSPEISRTIVRDNIWQAQTPQMFRYGLLRTALTDALVKKTVITDEASAMEAAGYPVKLVLGDARNIKITTPEQLQLANSILQIGLQ